MTSTPEEPMRFTRINDFNAALSGRAAEKAKSLRQEAEVNLARVYGNDLPPMITDRLIADFAFDGRFITAVFGTVNEMPQNRDAWTAYLHERVQSDPWAVACLASRDHARRANHKKMAVDALSPVDRMTRHRNGTVDSYADGIADDRIREAGRQQ